VRQQSFCLRIWQHTALTAAQNNVPLHRTALILLALFNTLIARITERCRFIAVQQRVGLGDIAHIGGSGDRRMGTLRNS